MIPKTPISKVMNIGKKYNRKTSILVFTSSSLFQANVTAKLLTTKGLSFPVNAFEAKQTGPNDPKFRIDFANPLSLSDILSEILYVFIGSLQILEEFINLLSKPEPEPETKHETKTETKHEPEPETKPETKTESKPETKTESKPESKPDTEPETKPETKTKPETEPETKPEHQKCDVVGCNKRVFTYTYDSDYYEWHYLCRSHSEQV